MFSKYFGIQLDNPCSEGWENMLPSEQGRFCLTCSKQVVDFTAMSDTEIVAYFRNHQNVCGRMYEDQLQRNLLPYTQKESIFKRIFAALLLMFQSFISEAQSQNKPPQAIVLQKENINDSDCNICTNKIPGDSGFFQTPLLIIDKEDDSTIYNATVILNGDTLKCTSPPDGRLYIELPLYMKDSTARLIVMKDDYTVFYHNIILDGNLFIIMMTKVLAKQSQMRVGGMVGKSTGTKSNRSRSNNLYRKYPGLFRDF